MKRFLSLVLGVAASTLMLYSQSETDVLLTSRNILTGSARSMSLSNAMGAIGGDLSALYINPAGIAIYQSSEFTFSQGLNFSGTKSDYEGLTRDDNFTSAPFQSIGFIGTYKPMRQTGKGLVSAHFSFNYNRTNNFSNNITVEGEKITSSMLDDFRYNAENLTPDDLAAPGYKQYFTSNLAYYAYLLEPIQISDNQISYYHSFEDYDIVDGEYKFYSRLTPNGINQKQYIDTRGYSGEYSFAGGINLSNQFYIGGSLNFQHLKYERSTSYREEPQGLEDAVNPVLVEGENLNVDYFEFMTNLNLQGNSVNAKLGLIYKPIHELRLGFAYHSPNFYNFQQDYYTYIKAGYSDHTSIDKSTETAQYDYNFRSPSKLIGSLGYLLGNFGFVSVDYEYQNVANSKFISRDRNLNFDGEFQDLNDNVKDHFQSTHAIRAGIEIKPQPSLALRIGGGYYTSPQKDGFRQELKANNLYTASGGIGYRNNLFFLDVAYMAIIQDYDYLPYNYDDPSNLGYRNQPVNIKSLDNRFAVTLGWKF